MQGYTRRTVKEDIPYLAVNLRKEDKAEIQASSGLDPEVALGMGLLVSKRCNTICLSDGTPAAIYGVNDTGVTGLGSIWLLATPDLLKVQRQFLRECREGISEISQGYSCVFNYTDARNAVHHKWLKWCGFTFIKEHKNFGKQQETFYEFVKITEGLPHV
ncbi:hypothetical protein CRP804_gp31 [Roseobacter phage CRP-804]|uniref:Internal virion protein A n=1 Tax=Roseobacter phage CRP-804 TaxID=3072850 RepID=A0AAX3ZV71_9CAUD|nr:hypothetical protein CRP804_gp31 [Roseobacter phage CRP-804]